MNLKEWNERVSTPDFVQAIRPLYADKARENAARYADLLKLYEKTFPGDAQITLFSAAAPFCFPARITVLSVGDRSARSAPDSPLYLEDNMKIVTFNLRCDNNGDGENRWQFRKGIVLDKIEAEAPDVIGFQEALQHPQLRRVERPSQEWLWQRPQQRFI